MRDVRKKEEHKKDNEKSTVLVRNNTVYINGEKQKKMVVPPTVLQLFPDEEEQKKINKIKFVNTETKPEKGSSFTAFACKVNSLEEVKRAYTGLSQDFATADHIAVAYDVQGYLGYHDDREFGSGYRLLETIKASMMSGVAVFVVRRYGGENLGPRRFTIMRNLAEEAINKLR